MAIIFFLEPGFCFSPLLLLFFFYFLLPQSFHTSVQLPHLRPTSPPTARPYVDSAHYSIALLQLNNQTQKSTHLYFRIISAISFPNHSSSIFFLLQTSNTKSSLFPSSDPQQHNPSHQADLHRSALRQFLFRSAAIAALLPLNGRFSEISSPLRIRYRIAKSISTSRRQIWPFNATFFPSRRHHLSQSISLLGLVSGAGLLRRQASPPNSPMSSTSSRRTKPILFSTAGMDLLSSAADSLLPPADPTIGAHLHCPSPQAEPSPPAQQVISFLFSPLHQHSSPPFSLLQQCTTTFSTAAGNKQGIFIPSPQQVQQQQNSKAAAPQ